LKGKQDQKGVKNSVRKDLGQRRKKLRTRKGYQGRCQGEKKETKRGHILKDRTGNHPTSGVK